MASTTTARSQRLQWEKRGASSASTSHVASFLPTGDRIPSIMVDTSNSMAKPPDWGNSRDWCRCCWPWFSRSGDQAHQSLSVARRRLPGPAAPTDHAEHIKHSRPQFGPPTRGRPRQSRRSSNRDCGLIACVRAQRVDSPVRDSGGTGVVRAGNRVADRTAHGDWQMRTATGQLGQPRQAHAGLRRRPMGRVPSTGEGR